MMKLIGSLIMVLVALVHCSEGFVVEPTFDGNAPNPMMTSHFQAPTFLSAYKNSKTTSRMKNKSISKGASETKNAVKEDDEKGGIFSKPANLIFLPFVAIFGLDLVLNILVLVKRSIEVALTGQYTCTGPWC